MAKYFDKDHEEIPKSVLKTFEGEVFTYDNNEYEQVPKSIWSKDIARPLSEREQLSAKEGREISREEYGDLVQKDMNKQIEEARYKEQDRAGFPKFTQSVEEGDPSYSALFGDIMSAPGRALRADLRTPENTTEEFLTSMSEVQPKSDTWYGKAAESVLQSPATLPLIATAPISMPALMTTGGLGGLADVEYSKDDADWKDYAISGSLGALTAPVGKALGKGIKEAGKKLAPNVKGILSEGVEGFQGQAVPGTKGVEKIMDIDKGLEAKAINAFNSIKKDLKRGAREGIELEMEKSKFINDAMKDGIPTAIKKYLNISSENIPTLDRLYDVNTRPAGIAIGDIMSGETTTGEMFERNPDWIFE
jgi:hypothetical protein